MSERNTLGVPEDPLANFLVERAGVRVRGLGPNHRWSLRANASDRDRLAKAWGGPLPERMLTAASGSRRHALRLGPDEWFLLAETENAAAELQAMEQDPAFSLVDVSERSVAVEVQGDKGATLLNAGNPLDLSVTAFPGGCCTRTVFGKAEIILWRPDDTPAWRLEVWRSFATYLDRYLTQALAYL